MGIDRLIAATWVPRGDDRVALIKALLRQLVAAAADNHALARRTRRQGAGAARRARAEVEALEHLIVALARGEAVPSDAIGTDVPASMPGGRRIHGEPPCSTA